MVKKADLNNAVHDNLLQRLLAKDTSLWTTDPEVAAQIQHRLGWLETVHFSFANAEPLARFRDRIRAEEFDRIILLGMGGSSLAPEVFSRCFHIDDGINLNVLDSTFPDAVNSITADAGRGKPLFIVSSKSGTTAETAALQSHFWQWSRARHTDAASDHFVAITDAQSGLHRVAEEHGYREIFLNPADIGGRYSALSLFGLVPASLLGIDIERLLNGAQTVFDGGPEAEQALRLGDLMGNAALKGRNKLTLTMAAPLSPLGAWIEQLVAESTGKEGKGIIPIIDEPMAPPRWYGADRLFVDISLSGSVDHDRSVREWHRELEQLGHPVFTVEMEDVYALGAEFARWQLATAIASSIVGVNPFDEPDVNATKKATTQILQQPPAQTGRGVFEKMPAAEMSDRLLHFLEGIMATDYAAILAYLPADRSCGDALDDLRQRISGQSGCATCLSLGPRYLHSSGQLHKGGPKNGHFLFLTASPTEDIGIPGRSYGFEHLINAQAYGDIQVLRQRGQNVLHLHLGTIAGAAAAIQELGERLNG